MYTDLDSNFTTTSSTPATNFQSTTVPVTPLLPQSTIIVIAVAGSLLVLAVVMIITTALTCCLLCRPSRERESTTTNNRALDVRVDNGSQQNTTLTHLVNNSAYNIGNTTDRIDNNPAYNYSPELQLADNQTYYYDYSGGTQHYYSVISEI